MAKAMTPGEKKAMVDMFNSLPADMSNKYEIVAKQFKKSTTTCFRAVKQAETIEPEVKYFDHTIFPF